MGFAPINSLGSACTKINKSLGGHLDQWATGLQNELRPLEVNGSIALQTEFAGKAPSPKGELKTQGCQVVLGSLSQGWAKLGHT